MARLRFNMLFLAGLAACAAPGLHAQQVAAPAVLPKPAPPKPAPKPAAKLGDKPLWSQLTPIQKTALEPLHAEWDPMEGVRKQKWLEFTKSYATMHPEEQQRVHERMRDWIRLTPAQRTLARQNFVQAKTLAPNEKSATWESYKQLPDEQKQKLAGQAARKPLTNLPPPKPVPRSAAPAAAPATTATATATAATVAPAAPVK